MRPQTSYSTEDISNKLHEAEALLAQGRVTQQMCRKLGLYWQFSYCVLLPILFCNSGAGMLCRLKRLAMARQPRRSPIHMSFSRTSAQVTLASDDI